MRHKTSRLIRRARIAWFVGCLLFVSAAARAQLTPGTDINLSQRSGADNECAISKNPANPNQLFASCNNSGPGLIAVRSTDGGVTWTFTDPADKTIADGDAGQGPAACCDPTTTWDSFGNLFLTYIDAGIANIVTLLSTDGGLTFTTLAQFPGSVDQPTIVSANTTAAGAPVAVWVVWNQSGQMRARGAAVTGLGVVGAFNALQTIPGTAGCSFGDIAIAPSGAVVQACQNPVGGQGPATIFVNIDADGLGAGNFGAAISATTTNVGGFDFIPAQNTRSVDSEAGLAFDSTPSSAHFGRLYLVYTEETAPENNDTDILLRFSDNNGANWSAPIRINDDPAAPIRSQFLPKIAVDRTTGNIAICWYDARNSGANTAAQLFCTAAGPSGATPTFLPNVLVSDGASTSTGAGIEFGDYAGLTYLTAVVHPIWADTSNSTGNNPNTTTNFDVLTDRVTGGPPTPQIQVPASITFPPHCGGAAQATASICNTGAANLVVTGITSSNAQFSVAPPTSGFPVTIAPGTCLPIAVTFSPTGIGPQSGTLTIASNDPTTPSATIAVSGSVGQPTIATMVVDSGDFGRVCEGTFRDKIVTIANTGTCPLTVTSIVSSSPEFQTPQVLSFPLVIAPGTSIEVPIRLRPTSAGPKSATITISSNDPAAPSKVVALTGQTPPAWICHPPTFASVGMSGGPAFGSTRTSDFTFTGQGRAMAPFGPTHSFGVQTQGEFIGYDGRYEGEVTAGLLNRWKWIQGGVFANIKGAELGVASDAGTLGQATFTLDVLLNTFRINVFGAKGFHDDPFVRVVDQFGGGAQVSLAPVLPDTWLEGNLIFLHPPQPLGNRPGAMLRISHQLFEQLELTAEVTVNESLLGPTNNGRVVVGFVFGRWARPKDLANRETPLGTDVPRVHYVVR
jgi:hypothetical protein